MEAGARGNLSIAVYTIHGDESHDEKKKRTFAVGTVCGDDTEWSQVASRWESRLGGMIFHATDCDTDRGAFKDIPHSENKALYKDLCTILCESKLFGIGVAIMLPAFRQIFPGAPAEMPYYMCFTESTYESMKTAAMCIPKDIIEVIFDRHPETEYNSGLLYDHFINSQMWRDMGDFFEKVSFATRKTTGIQVADLVARETMKAMDNIVSGSNRRVRGAMQALLATGRFEFKYWGPSLLAQLDAKMKSVGFEQFDKDRREYQEWLDRKGVQDNMTSRIVYGMTLK